MKKIVFVTFKSLNDYFRKFLIENMQKSRRYQIMYVCFLEEKMFVYEEGVLTASYNYQKKNYSKVVKHIKGFKKRDRLTLWTSLGFGNKKIYYLMRFSFPFDVLIYDVFDYFYYYEMDQKTISKWKFTDRLFQMTANKTITLSKELSKIYKNSYWLTNASHLEKRAQKAFHKRIGLICSIEYRVDFDLLSTVARTLPDHELSLYGWIKGNNPEIKETLDKFLKDHPNVKYYGAYKNDDLKKILSTIDIGIVPYRTQSDLSKFINPDKIFHYLCYGLEVVSTPMPAAMELQEWVHIAETAADFVGTIQNIYDGRDLRNTGEFYRQNNWDARLRELEQKAII